ncbi:hypothetical protein [Roseateles koreensis]|uniref:DUF4148 domain-containing protein n=1 Tax=Roseateles koreensis TaxID=2987526 RepID=A0ABT5KNP5_9BURK|nr:hypothetical protein [Roseateles koreensis]MDC8784548.1 hypothetical protein [Roseateles koreensis]
MRTHTHLFSLLLLAGGALAQDAMPTQEPAALRTAETTAAAATTATARATAATAIPIAPKVAIDPVALMEKEPTAAGFKTRANVVAELKRARESGEMSYYWSEIDPGYRAPATHTASPNGASNR